MEEKILKKTAVFFVVVLAVVCLSMPYFPRLGILSEELLAAYREYRTKTESERLGMNGIELMEYNNAQAKEAGENALSFSSQIRLELPLGVSGNDLKITEDVVTQTITIQIPFAGEDYFYEYPVLGRSDHIDSLTYENKKSYGIVEFITDQVCELKSEYDEDYVYIDFLTPQELYDKVVVIDAGHGGDAPGATKQGICEKDIDLDIVLKIKELFDTAKDPSIGVYYTRTEDVNPGFENRVGLANKSGADLFISIHNNSTKSGRMSSIHGTQVMYDEKEDETEYGSKRFAQICLEEVTAAAGSSNKGLVDGNEVYVIGNCKAPAALIEVGFMTNQAELEKLCSKEYQSKVAKGIYQAVLRAFAEGY